MNAYDTLLAEMTAAEAAGKTEAKVWYGTFGLAPGGHCQDRYLTVRRGYDNGLVVSIYGTEIAGLTPAGVQLWARGHGDKPSTRAALAACYRGPGSVYSRDRLLWAGAHPFTEGMVLNYDGELVEAGDSGQVTGAPARRRRDEMGVLR